MIKRTRSKYKFYTYVWLNPLGPGKYKYGEYKFDYEPFNIGKGKGKRAYDFKRDYNNILKRILKKFSFPIVLFLKEKVIEEEAFAEEIRAIATIGRRNQGKGPLANMTDGGEGQAGRIYICSEETKQRQKEAGIKAWQSEEVKQTHKESAKNRSPDSQKTKQKKKECQTFEERSEHSKKAWITRRANGNADWSEESKQKQRESHIGKHPSEETKRRSKEARTHEERSEAGKKSSITKRMNGNNVVSEVTRQKLRESKTFEERSEASKKTWETRRRKGGVSESAKKAWETRRHRKGVP